MLEMLQAVEPPVFYAIAGVILLAVASLFGLVLFASREETFEDVVAKQRKAQEALLTSLQGGSGKSGKQNRKWNKLKNKKASKVKEQEENEIDSGVDDDEVTPESLTISDVPAPPTIAVEEPPPPPTTSKKKKKGKKNKGQQQEVIAPVVEEKAEEPPAPEVVEEEVDVVEEVTVEEEPEQIEEDILAETTEDLEAAPEEPSDVEVAAAEEEDVSDEEADEIPVNDNEEAIEEVEAVPEEVEPEADIVAKIAEATTPIPEPEPEPVVEPVAPSTTKPRKKKSNKSGQQKGVITNTVDKVTAELDSSQLSSDEVQQIMDILQKKQDEFEQWQKPNQKADPMEILKKRIAEAEMQFAEERQSAQAIAMKNKELRLELQQERNARQSIQNEASNRLTQQAKEGESLRKRMEEKHMSEMHSHQSQISRMQVIIDDGANHHMELQRLKEENGHLKNASMMASQLAEDKQSLMTELSQLQQTNKALRQDLDNVIYNNGQELQNLNMAKVESETALSQRLQEVNEQLMKYEAQNRSMQQQIEVAAQCKVEMESQQMAAPQPDEVDELNSKLLQLQTQFDDSESIVKVLHEQLETKTKELEESRALLSEAQSKLVELQSQLSMEEEEEELVVPEVVPEQEAEPEVEVVPEPEVLPEQESVPESEEVPEPVEIPEQETVPEVEAEPEQDSEKEVEPVNEEVANLVAKVQEKDELILQLEQKLSSLENQANQSSSSSSGQHSPDMVVVHQSDLPSELLSSEPIMTSESFEEVNADKDLQDDDEIDLTKAVDLAVEVTSEAAGEAAPEESLLVEAPVVSNKSVECLEKEIEEAKSVEHSLRETIATMEAEQTKAAEELKAAQTELAEKIALITANNDTIVIDPSEAGGVEEAERQLDEKDETIREKECELIENMVNISDLQSELDGKPDDAATDNTIDLEKVISEKDELINEWKEKAEKLEEETTRLAAASTEAASTKEELGGKLKTVEEELSAKTEVAAQLTMKNNELREKNWKVIDALGKAESDLTEKIKKIDISICKGLKNMFPDTKIPKYEGDYDLLFKEFGNVVVESTAQKSIELQSEMTKVEEINAKLAEEITELKKTNELMQASQDEILKSQEENVHLKNVLTETETMLSRLQTGVDAEVQKWQKKVNEKEEELEETKKSHLELTQILSKHGYEHENLTTLETNLSDGQKQLMAEKEENTRIKTELQEVEKTLAETREERDQQTKEKEEYTKKLNEEQEKAKPAISSTELTDLNNKLKKTVSERDLLIREYKSMKDNKTKLDAELQSTKDSLASKIQSADAFTTEITQLKAQIATMGDSNNTGNDDMIAKLNIEIKELKEELREQQDCVIVGIDPDNAENLTKQVENLSTELESEKQCKASLETKLQDIEKSYQEECSDTDKILNLESKLKGAELRIKELEDLQSTPPKSPNPRQDVGDPTVGTSV